jgi:hypothetical protein
MMTFEFLLTFDLDGLAEQRSFSVAATTLSSAVTQSLDRLVREKPDARFKGLTYYAAPVEPFGLRAAAPAG